MYIFNNANNFFSSFVYDCRAWSKDIDMVYERGAWVHYYGIPLHALNVRFFRKLVAVRRRLLKIDESIINNLRLDYARIFITTKFLEGIKELDYFWVDGKKILIHFV